MTTLNKKLLILNNIGSPDSFETQDVRKYLREFLMDPRVIQIPWIFRFFLVYGIISFFRAGNSALKYKKIWTEQGSPLKVHTQNLQKKLEKNLPGFDIRIGMRYQTPSINESLRNFKSYEQIVFAPLYPQFAESTTGSAIEKFYKELKKLSKKNTKDDSFNKTLSLPSPEIKILKPFWNDSAFIQAWVQQIKHSVSLKEYDVLLFSYHGLPESQLKKSSRCQFQDSCCSQVEMALQGCYRSQCFHTTNLIISALKRAGVFLDTLKVLTTFQSRLGRAKWIEPYTDETLINLGSSLSTKRVLVCCPAFVSDCLETLEEIKIENKNEFLKAGGEKFDYIDCLNDSDFWANNLAQMIKNTLS